jgi:hypothetical protein
MHESRRDIPMTVRFELPSEIEQNVQSNGLDINREAMESYLVDLNRQERITHYQLALG